MDWKPWRATFFDREEFGRESALMTSIWPSLPCLLCIFMGGILRYIPPYFQLPGLGPFFRSHQSPHTYISIGLCLYYTFMGGSHFYVSSSVVLYTWQVGPPCIHLHKWAHYAHILMGGASFLGSSKHMLSRDGCTFWVLPYAFMSGWTHFLFMGGWTHFLGPTTCTHFLGGPCCISFHS